MIQIETNVQEIIRRLIKYCIHTILIVFLLVYGPCKKLESKDVIVTTLATSCVFVLLDIYSPSVVVLEKKKE
jgi:hypothetical protein